MKKKLWGLMLALIFGSITMSAQSYSALWKQVDKAHDNDLPKTALAAVDRVWAKAVKEGNAPQELKALLIHLQMASDISPDSTAPALKHIEARLAVEHDPVMQALYHYALGSLYSDSYNSPTKPQSRKHFEAVLPFASALAKAKASDYLPLIVEGKDSRLIYNDDLLHFILPSAASHLRFEKRDGDAQAQAAYGTMRAIYRAQGNRRALLLTAIDSIRIFSSKRQEAWKALIPQYQDLSECAEVYINLLGQASSDSTKMAIAQEGIARYPKYPRTEELRNWIKTAEQPRISVDISMSRYPMSEDSIIVRATNRKSIAIRFYNLQLAASDTLLNHWNEKKFLSRLGKPDYEITSALPQAKSYEQTRQRINFTVPPCGTYLVQADAEGLKSAFQLYSVTALDLNTFQRVDGRTDLLITDRMSGKPIPQARLTFYRDERNKRIFTDTLYTDADGQAFIENGHTPDVFVSKGKDVYRESSYISTSPRRSESKAERESSVYLFTDRAIYRPGQTLKMGGIAYWQLRDSLHTVADSLLTVALYDANGKKLSEQKLRSDAFGSFGGSFTLPEKVLPGRFSLRTTTDLVAFNVENYKRPTFTVSFDELSTPYAAGDTVTLIGHVKTYNRLPVTNARVHYDVKRSTGWWLRRVATTMFSGDTLTDATGSFSIRVPLTPDTLEAMPLRIYPYHLFTLEANATSEDGETQKAQTSISIGRAPRRFATNWPDLICKEKVEQVTFSLKNNNGQNIEGEGHYTLTLDKHIVLEGDFKANQQLLPPLKTLPSGRYELKARTSDGLDTLKQAFTLFSFTDRRPIGDEALQVYDLSSQLSRDSAVTVLVGSALKDATLFYSVSTNKEVLENRRIDLTDSLMPFTYIYKDKYGDGISLLFLIVRDGKTYSKNIRLEYPTPDKELTLQWSSFRDRLRPSQTEEWRLRVLRQGKPVSASVMATLYDASLDAFTQLSWRFEPTFTRNIPYCNWQNHAIGQTMDWSAETPITLKDVRELSFSRFNDDLLYNSYQPTIYYARNNTRMRLMAAAPSMNMVNTLAMDEATAEVGNHSKKMSKTMRLAGTGETSPLEEGLRTNFNESAFFASGIATDSKSEALLRFTLPESMTAWHFRALAHTKTLDYAFADTTAIAQKAFTIQPNMPRFLRVGDATELAATLRNLSDKEMKGTVKLTFIDPETEKVVAEQSQSFRLLAGAGQTVKFPYVASSDHSLLVCRFMASNKQFSDGEQHYLPVLDNRETVVSSLSLTLDKAGTERIDLTTLLNRQQGTHRRLTVEYTATPAWLALQALPSLIEPSEEDALSWAASYYATTKGAAIVAAHPEIKQWIEEHSGRDSVVSPLTQDEDLKQMLLHETPWVSAADREAERSARLRRLIDNDYIRSQQQTCYNHLLALQGADGGWSWYKGMHSNPYITHYVTEMLLKLAPSDARIKTMTRRALIFLDTVAAKCVKAMKEDKEKGTLDEDMLHYLYLRTLDGRPADDVKNYLLKRLDGHTAAYNIYDKALSVLILADAKREDAAKLTLQSILEHTVSTAEMGRYFDTDHAWWSWDSYKIPTQVAALEAVSRLTPDDSKTLHEMTRWLMQAKRTETWGNALNSVDAIHYLMSDGRLSTLSAVPPRLALLLKGGRRMPLLVPNQPYSRTTLDVPQGLEAVEATKADASMGWCAVYVEQNLPVSEVTAEGSGLKVTQEVTRLKNGTWETVANGTPLQMGEKIRIRYTLTADRDYDFVSLRAPRAACLEPGIVLSGYGWNGYRAIGDAATTYFFDHFAKGQHIVVAEANVDRSGTFSTGIPVVQCAYAPAFRGNAQNATLITEKK